MGYQIIEPSAGSTDWVELSTMINDMMQGFMALSLTNYDTTDVPLIAAGGKVEVAGSLYSFSSSEDITGSLSTNQNYIMLTTSSSSISASYTSDAPTWIPSKHGWYDSSTGVQRYIGGLSTDNDGKWIYETGQQNRVQNIEEVNNGITMRMKVIEIGIWNMDSLLNKTVAHGINDFLKIRDVITLIQRDAQTSMRWLVGSESSGVTNGKWSVGASNVFLLRYAGGTFDSTDYNSTILNRGWITIWYEA